MERTKEAMRESLRRYPKKFLQRIASHPVENYLDGRRAEDCFISMDRCG